MMVVEFQYGRQIIDSGAHRRVGWHPPSIELRWLWIRREIDEKTGIRVIFVADSRLVYSGLCYFYCHYFWGISFRFWGVHHVKTTLTSPIRVLKSRTLLWTMREHWRQVSRFKSMLHAWISASHNFLCWTVVHPFYFGALPVLCKDHSALCFWWAKGRSGSWTSCKGYTGAYTGSTSMVSCTWRKI